MICVDTTFLVDLWREKDQPDSPAWAVFVAHRGEDLSVPAHAASGDISDLTLIGH